MKHVVHQEVCQICQENKYASQVVKVSSLTKGLHETIKQNSPKWDSEGYVCLNDLNHFRTKHIEEIMTIERGKLSHLENEVARSISEEELLNQNIETSMSEKATFGQRVADKVATFGGSWTFIILFGTFIAIWITINSAILIFGKYDPYPFILLNLMLSCLAALQAPVIMMSQNRQEIKDRLRAENDFKVNLKAEMEIRILRDKVDHLMNEQLQNLMESQQILMEMMEEVLNQKTKETEEQ